MLPHGKETQFLILQFMVMTIFWWKMDKNAKLRNFIIFIVLKCSKILDSPTMKILQISDVHLDLSYTIGSDAGHSGVKAKKIFIQIILLVVTIHIKKICQ